MQNLCPVCWMKTRNKTDLLYARTCKTEGRRKLNFWGHNRRWQQCLWLWAINKVAVFPAKGHINSTSKKAKQVGSTSRARRLFLFDSDGIFHKRIHSGGSNCESTTLCRGPQASEDQMSAQYIQTSGTLKACFCITTKHHLTLLCAFSTFWLKTIY